MKSNLSKALITTVSVLAASHAVAQHSPLPGPYDSYCWPPNSATGPSTNFNEYYMYNTLWGCLLGISGTDTYGDTANDPRCGNEVMTVTGKFGWAVGSVGSIQSSADDNLTLTWGMPSSVGDSCGFAQIVTGTAATGYTRTTFGGSALASAYFGASDRYCVAEQSSSTFDVFLRIDSKGDASEFTWSMYNNTATTLNMGLLMGSWVFPCVTQPLTDGNHITFVYAPGYKPFLTEQDFKRSVNGVPDTITFALTQQNPYGIQLINSPTTGLQGVNVSDQTPVTEVAIGQHFDLLNPVGPFNAPAPIFPVQTNSDVAFIEDGLGQYFDRASWLQFWDTQPVGPGGSTSSNRRQIISYYRSPWGVSDYAAPFAAVVDAPKVITTDSSNPSNYTNGTFDFRVYIDNVGGYATIGKSVPVTGARIEVDLPAGMVNASSGAGSGTQKIVGFINDVEPGATVPIDFQVKVLPTIAPGPQTYNVLITTPSGVSKNLVGTINVSSQPNLTVGQNANLVTLPWSFTSGDWGSILGLTPNTDFQAFDWDSSLGYINSAGPKRGVGEFIVSNLDHGQIALNGNPVEPPDTIGGDVSTQTSDVFVQLYPGWNLVGNPFNYTVQLGELVGVDKGNSQATPQTFAALVQQGLISPSFAYYNPASQGYEYISGASALMLPNVGYWVYISSVNQVVLYFPPVLLPGARSATPAFTQSESQWQLQLVAHDSKHSDAQNYVGVASPTVAKALTTQKPPMNPGPTGVSLAVVDSTANKVTPLARSMRSTGGNNQSWTIQVTSKTAEPITVTWPNIKSVPADVQFQITDTATGATRDLRRGSGYTFNSTANTVRAFTIVATPGSSTMPAIGNVLVTRSRALNGPVNVSYALATTATVSVNILSNGRTIYQPVSARAVSAGTNTVTWNLRDSANRQVAPGQYQIEIIAEGSNGQRVRRMATVTVTR